MDRRVTAPKRATSPTWRPHWPLVGHEPREGKKFSQAVERGRGGGRAANDPKWGG